MTGRTNRLIWLAAALLIQFSVANAAKFKIGWKCAHAEYAKAWGVDVEAYASQFSKNDTVQVQLIKSNIPANVLWPADKAKLVFQFKNLTDKEQTVSGHFDLDQHEARNQALGSIGQTRLRKVADIETIPFTVVLPPNGAKHITIEPQIPERFGGYVIIVDLDEAGRLFGAGLSRAPKPVLPRTLFRQINIDRCTVEEMTRTGTYPNRMPLKVKFADPGFTKYDSALNELHEAGMTTTVEFGGRTELEAQPMGRGRKHLDDEGVMIGRKEDIAWLPAWDDKFEESVYQLLCRHGYPKGAINGVMLWNEPWEGLSISGWGADMPRYREIYRRMAMATERARKDAGVQVLIGGCDSTSNTLDKLFGDGKDTFLKWLDFESIHYQKNNPGTTIKKFMQRKHPNGRVLIWDTESWIANTEELVPVAYATGLSFGQDRVVGVFGNGAFYHAKVRVIHPDGSIAKQNITHAWPITAAIAAGTSLIGERKFKELLFPNGLPWIMVFDGMKNADGVSDPDDGTLVVSGDIGSIFRGGPVRFPFWGVRGLVELTKKDVIRKKLATAQNSEERQELKAQLESFMRLEGASLTLSDGAGRFKLLDMFGNIIPAKDGQITIPLGIDGYYLRTDKSPGSFAALVKAVRAARIEGYEPLDIICRDMTAPIHEKPTLALELTNVLNRPVEGALHVSLGNLTVEAPASLRLAPHETRTVPLRVTGGQASPDNTYPLAVIFNAGADGRAEHREDMHVNRIHKKTIVVDGKLDDWAGALPQPIRITEAAQATLEEEAWFPYQELPAAMETGFSVAYLAHDDDYFYFAAKVVDTTPDEGMHRFETLDDDQFFYPPVAYELDGEKTLLMEECTWKNENRAPYALQHPQNKDAQIFSNWSTLSKSMALDLDLPVDKTYQITLHFIDQDHYGNGRTQNLIEIYDRVTGRQLCEKKRFTEYGRGCYAVYEMAGAVRIKITRTWLPSSIDAVFIDASSQNGMTGTTAARFVKEDRDTQRNWQGKYGALGHWIAGLPQALPADVKIAFAEKRVLAEWKWPEDVRRYSYRMRPYLPSGSRGNRGSADNIQIAFNAIPVGQGGEWEWEAFPKGTRLGYTGYRCTDYEYALNPVAKKFGGGTEIWRLKVPNQPHKHFYPRQGKSRFDGPVKNGKLSIRHDGNTRIVECAIPWSELPHVKALRDAGKPVKFSYRVNDNAGKATMELAKGRSVSKYNVSFHPDWAEHWANEVEFSFEK